MITSFHPHGDSSSLSSSHSPRRRWPRFLQTPRRRWGAVIAVAALLLVVIGTNIRSAAALYDSALSGKDEFLKAQEFILKQDFDQADAALKKGVEHFETGQIAVRQLWEFRWIPMVGRQIRAIDHALTAGVQTGLALQKITALASDVMSSISDDSLVSLASISSEQKGEMLNKIYQSTPELAGAKADIDLALISLQRIPSWGLLPPIQKAVDPMKELLPKIQQSISDAIPAAEALPQIVGTPRQKTYLFLLQNNTELRPTGGFIGTYGVLKVQNGEIEAFHTDNIYNLDNLGRERFQRTPPDAIKKYLQLSQWLMRDSNWDPDFPSAAATTEEFYHEEGGPEPAFDGVISVTPTFIEALIALTGDITVNGITFTKDNFVETLQFQVEQGFYRQGIADSERKEIIGAMADILVDRLLAFPKTRWTELWETTSAALNEKQILIFLKNDRLQALVREEGWAGEVRSTEGDFVMVVDANLASLKTDPAVERTIRHELKLEGDDAIATTSIHYTHKGSFKWKITRYRTYTRLLVPEGSELLSSSGARTQDKLHGGKPADAQILEAQWGKTIFGSFISIEPGAEGELSWTYRLPKRIADDLRQHRYTLLVQKQSGTTGHAFEGKVDGGRLSLDQAVMGNRNLTNEGLDKLVTSEDNGIRITSVLKEDFELWIQP